MPTPQNIIINIEGKLDNLERAAATLERAKANPSSNNFNSEQRANNALQQLKPKILGYLTANLTASGIKSRSGHLLEAISQSKVWIVVKGSEYVLRFGYKPGLVNDVYVYGNSLNYGAVHNAGGVSAGGRRKIKKQAKSGQSLGGGAYITPARGFYKLSSSQLGDVKVSLIALLNNSGQGQVGNFNLTQI